MNTAGAVWILVMVAFTVVELCTFNMLTLWFVLGGAAAFISSMLGASVPVQLWIFVAVSIVCLVVTKPIVAKKLQTKRISTNADRIIGMRAVVTEDISPEKFAGRVNVSGQEWSAISKDGGVIPRGATVTVAEINGVKLVVEE